MGTYLRVLLAMQVCVTAAIVLAPPSSADQIVHRDKLHDVVMATETRGPIEVQPGRVDPDVVRTRVDHRDHALVLALHFLDLRPRESRFLNVDFETDDRNSYYMGLSWRRNGAATVTIEHPAGANRIPCPKLRQHVNVRRDLISVRIPRGCLGSPRWVRVSMVIVRTRHQGLVTFIDEPLRSIGTRLEQPNFTRKLFPG